MVRIELEAARRLTVAQELALVAAGHARTPTTMLRDRLARLLFANDQFAEMIALIGDADALDCRGEDLLAQAWLSLETADADGRALAAAQRAVDKAGSDALMLAAALATRAKAETRLGRRDAALETLRQALALDPHNKNACKRILALLLDAGRPDEAGAKVTALVAQGVAHARLFAADVLAHAQLGDLDSAGAALGLDRFFCAQPLPAPPGWDSIGAFNAALAEELLAHPGLRFERYGSASELTWRIDNPLMHETPLVRALLEQIRAELSQRIARLGASDHPWLRAMPADAVLRAWCVITDSTGYETWHVHQFGWLSGAYYVQVPAAIAEGEGDPGCIAFGLPEDLAGAEAAERFGARRLRPQQGLMATFPSHTYHRTFPHGCGERRICVAFDLRPA